MERLASKEWKAWAKNKIARRRELKTKVKWNKLQAKIWRIKERVRKSRVKRRW
jgi:hypothetical protein